MGTWKKKNYMYPYYYIALMFALSKTALEIIDDTAL